LLVKANHTVLEQIIFPWIYHEMQILHIFYPYSRLLMKLELKVKKVHLSLCLTKHHAVKTYGRVEV